MEFQVAVVHPALIAVQFFCVEQVEDERDGNPQGGPVLVMLKFVWPAQGGLLCTRTASHLCQRAEVGKGPCWRTARMQ